MISFKVFAEQKPYEKIQYVIRRHWLILACNIALLTLEIVLPILVFFVLNDVVSTAMESPVLGPALLLLASTYALFIWLLFFHNFIDYYLDTWIITNERLIHIEQKGFFSRTLIELRFFRVQEIASDVDGFIPTLFGYGTVTVQTAGEGAGYVMKQVPRAHEVARHVQRFVDDDRQYHKDKVVE